MIVLSGALVLVALVLLVFGALDRNLPYVYASIGVSVLSLLLLLVGILQRRGQVPEDEQADAAAVPVRDSTGERSLALVGAREGEAEAGTSQHGASDSTSRMVRPVAAPAPEAEEQPERWAPEPRDPRPQQQGRDLEDELEDDEDLDREDDGADEDGPEEVEDVRAKDEDDEHDEAEAEAEVDDDDDDEVEDEDEHDEADDDSASSDVTLRGAAGQTVLVVAGRARYHRAGCRYLYGKQSESRVLSEACAEGFAACGVCKPDAAYDEEAYEREPSASEIHEPDVEERRDGAEPVEESSFVEPVDAGKAEDDEAPDAADERLRAQTLSSPVLPDLAAQEPEPAAAGTVDVPVSAATSPADETLEEADLDLVELGIARDDESGPTVQAEDVDAALDAGAASQDRRPDTDALGTSTDETQVLDADAIDAAVAEQAGTDPATDELARPEGAVADVPWAVGEPAGAAPEQDHPGVSLDEATAGAGLSGGATSAPGNALDDPAVADSAVENTVSEDDVAADGSTVDADAGSPAAAAPAKSGSRAKAAANKASKAKGSKAKASKAKGSKTKAAGEPAAPASKPAKKTPARKAPAKAPAAAKAPASETAAPASTAPRKPPVRTVRADALRLTSPAVGRTSTTRVAARGAATPPVAAAAPSTGARPGQVVVVPDRDRFHRPDCRFVRDVAGATALPKASAADQGYAPCGVCKP